jgi:pyridoxal phosphate enzyme (YggS family)
MNNYSSSELIKNYEEVQSTIKSPTKLLSVCKTKPAAMTRDLYEHGVRDFAENQVQDLLAKSIQLADLDEIRWHFIGKLQSNKINQLLRVENLGAIHSIDSLKLLKKILVKEPKQKINLFLQVNTSGETEKSGFLELDQIKEAAALISNSKYFQLTGLMTIGKIRTENFEKDAKACFKSLSDLRDSLGSEFELSMGMSSDYKIAMEYGANWVRIGAQIFGQRLRK